MIVIVMHCGSFWELVPIFHRSTAIKVFLLPLAMMVIFLVSSSLVVVGVLVNVHGWLLLHYDERWVSNWDRHWEIKSNNEPIICMGMGCNTL